MPGTCLRSGPGGRDSRGARSNQSSTWRTRWWWWWWWCHSPWRCAGPSYHCPDPASHPSLTCRSRQSGVKNYLDFVSSVTQSWPASHPVLPPDMFFFHPLELLGLLGLLGPACPGNEAPSFGEPGDTRLHCQPGYRVSCCEQNFYHIWSSLVGGAGSDGCQENQIG